MRLCMNRVIPIGGPHIHCEPPPHMTGNRPQSDSGMDGSSSHDKHTLLYYVALFLFCLRRNLVLLKKFCEGYEMDKEECIQ